VRLPSFCVFSVICVICKPSEGTFYPLVSKNLLPYLTAVLSRSGVFLTFWNCSCPCMGSSTMRGCSIRCAAEQTIRPAFIRAQERRLVAGGLECTMCANHFGHFLLTYLLVPHMHKTAIKSGSHGRIVNVTSSLHRVCLRTRTRNTIAHTSILLSWADSCSAAARRPHI
jgi:hypothetical protein